MERTDSKSNVCGRTTVDPNGIPFTLTVHELTRILGIGKNTAYGLIRSGVISAVRIGRQIRIPRAELYRYLGISVE